MKLKITLALLLLPLFGRTQQIDVKALTIPYATGSLYNTFPSTFSGTTGNPATLFTLKNTGTETLEITDVVLSGADPGSFVITQPLNTNVLPDHTTTFTVAFSPNSPGTKTATITIASNAAISSGYTINLSANAVASKDSVIITTPAYPYPTNIPYLNYQSTDIGMTGNAIEVGSFILKDGNGTSDADNLPTLLTNITFTLSNSSNVRSIALYEGSTQMGTDENGAESVSFNGLTLEAPDNGAKTFTIRISYNDVVTDNAVTHFTITAATASPTGSAFLYSHSGTLEADSSAAKTVIAGDNNKIEVTATKLGFLLGPTDTSTFTAMSPITVEALDAFHNRDLDYNSNITLVTTGTFNTAGVPVNVPVNTAVSGLASFSSIVHSTPGSGLILKASSGILTASASNSFAIGFASAASNFFRSRASGDWNLATNWETSHTNFDNWHTSTLVPTSSSRGINILNGHIITCTTTENADQMTIQAGGTLVLNDGAYLTLGDAIGTDLTVNGMLTYNGGTLDQLGDIVFGETGTYHHAIASSSLTLPLATWHVFSTCSITGLNNTTPIVASNMNQTFGILNWNNPNQSGYVAVNDAAFEIDGTLNIGTANPNNVLCLADSGTYTNSIRTVNITGGKLIAAAGSGNSTMTITGVTTVSGGAFIGSQGSGTATINTTGAFTVSSGKFILINAASSGNVNFTISGAKDLSLSGTGALFLENVSSASGIATLTINRDFLCSSTATPAVDFGTGTVTDNAINIKRNLSKTDGTFKTTSSNAAKGFVFINAGAQTLTYSGTDSSSVSYTVNSGSILTMGSNLTFGSATGPESVFTVQDGGRLVLGTKVITGNATLSRVNIENGATLSSSHTGGIGGVGALGSFQGFGNVNTTPATGRLSLAAGVHYILTGNTTTPFPVGAGITFGNPATLTTSANITSNMTSALTITSAFNVTANTFKLNTANNNLVLDNAVLTITGVFDNNGENQIINGSGSPSIIINGRLITHDIQGFVGINTAIPTIVPILGAASTVEYALAGNQAVQGSPAYKNLTISGSGTKTLDSNTTVATKITIASTTIFDTQSFTAGGTGTALTMTGTAQYKISGTGVKPDATGTYTLAAGSSVEFYGSQPLEIRLGSPAISYGKIVVNGTDVSNNSATTGIQFLANAAALFTVKTGATFKFKNTDGFTGSSSTALVPLANAILETNSTVEYAGANQIITPYNSTTNNSYKKVKISGTGEKTLGDSSITVRDNLTITSSMLKIESLKTLSVANEIVTVNTTATNGILIENNGSLVQTTVVDNATTNVNAGNINMQRITQPMYRYDFTYWGSPVKDFSLDSLSPITLFNKYTSWNASTSAWVTHPYGTDLMEAGKGYAVRAPQNFSINPTVKVPYTANFTGVPNNGTVTIGTVGNGVLTPEIFNLLGNPYPSAIDLNLFLSTSPNNTRLQGTVYLWTHSTPVDNYSYSESDYAAYNLSGPVGGASRYLAAGQGFFVKGISAGATSVTFTNAMRVANNNNFFQRPDQTTPVENWETTGSHRVWLNMKNTQGVLNQILVGYIENATDGLDWGYDGEQFGGNQVKFYSLLEEKNYTIQGKALPFSDEDEVPLGYKTTLAGNLQISIDHYDGLFEGQDVYLEDNLLNIVHDLKESAYNFNSAIGTFDDRFVLRYLPAEELNNPGHEDIANGLIVYRNNNEIMIKSQLETLEQVTLYDLLGRIVFDKKGIGQNKFGIQNVVMSEQPLIVKTKLSNGQVVNKTIIY